MLLLMLLGIPKAVVARVNPPVAGPFLKSAMVPASLTIITALPVPVVKSALTLAQTVSLNKAPAFPAASA